MMTFYIEQAENFFGFGCCRCLFVWRFFNVFLAINIEEGSGTPLQYSCLENPMDGEAW